MRIEINVNGLNVYIDIDNDTKVQLVDEETLCKVYTAKVYAEEMIETTTFGVLERQFTTSGHFSCEGVGCGIDALSAASNAIHNSTLIGPLQVEALVRSEIEARELKGKTVQASCEAKSRRL